MAPDMLLPVTVYDLPASFVFQPDGALREKIRYFVGIGVVSIAAGPTTCNVTVDVKRPYYRAM